MRCLCGVQWPSGGSVGVFWKWRAEAASCSRDKIRQRSSAGRKPIGWSLLKSAAAQQMRRAAPEQLSSGKGQMGKPACLFFPLSLMLKFWTRKCTWSRAGGGIFFFLFFLFLSFFHVHPKVDIFFCHQPLHTQRTVANRLCLLMCILKRGEPRKLPPVAAR